MWKIIFILIALLVIYKIPLYGKIPKEMIEKAEELDKMSSNKLELVKSIYNFVNVSYQSPIRQYLREPEKIFIKDISAIWNLKGSYMPSNAQNDMAKQLLLLTGKFNESNFRIEQKWCEISPHQIMFVNVDGKEFISIDPESNTSLTSWGNA